jgi:hypothetical protein
MLEPTRLRPETCLSDRALDTLMAGELAPDARARAEQHLPGCAACDARRRELEAARGAFPLEAPAFAKIVAAVSPARARRRTWWLGGAFAMAAAAASMILAVRATPDTDAVRTKGGAKLGFFVSHGDIVREGGPREVVHAGDRLQLVYTITQPRHLAVFLRDSEGTITTVFPRGTTAAKVEPGTNVPLPESLLLDGALGVETLLGVFCDHAAPVEALRRGADAPGDPPDGCHLERLSYEKR